MPDLHQQAESIAKRIEAELKALNRWDREPLPQDKYENMGAFGSNRMAFVQWLQFILIPGIREIVEENSDFPGGSKLAAYAIRELDGDPNSGQLHGLLYELDRLVNGTEGEIDEDATEYAKQTERDSPAALNSVSLGDTSIPTVLFTIADLLPQFEGADLESQLQTIDTFLEILSPSVRRPISDLLKQASEKTSNASSRLRIEKAAQSVTNGGGATELYDHLAVMKKYKEKDKSHFPIVEIHKII